MEQVIDAKLLAQVAAEESGKIFQGIVREFARQIILESIVEEVKQLCGEKHYPSKDHEFRRAGSAPGVICVEDSRVEIRRPRVRQKSVDGQEVEYNLNTYEAAQNTKDLTERILAAYMAGVPTRSMREMLPNALIQRCLVHLERNARGYMSHKHYGRIAELFKKLRLAQGAEEGRHAFLALKRFLRGVNHQAWKCVQGVGLDAIMILRRIRGKLNSLRETGEF